MKKSSQKSMKMSTHKSQKKEKTIFSIFSKSKFFTRFCCCSKIIEVEAMPISNCYFKRFAPSNITLRGSKRAVSVTGIAKFRQSKKMKRSLHETRRASMAEDEMRKIQRLQQDEANQIMLQILDGKRAGTVTYKINRSRSQPILRINL